MKAMCATCPWREGSPYAELKEILSERSKVEGRICHSTGNSIINGQTGKEPRICRGSRDEQLAAFHAMGFIADATDEAWDAKCKEMRI